MLTTMIYLRSGITNLKQFIYGLMAAFCVTSVAQEVCRPPLIFFDVHREELKDGWLHTTGGSAYETRITEVDYYDNRPIVDSLFSSQGQVTLTNVSSTSRIIKYRHRVSIKRGTYTISQDSTDYEVCVDDGQVIFYYESPALQIGVPHVQEWTYSVEIQPYGDFNNDGDINGSDLGMMFANWGMVGVTDINNDEITDGIDLGILLENWTG